MDMALSFQEAEGCAMIWFVSPKLSHSPIDSPLSTPVHVPYLNQDVKNYPQQSQDPSRG